MGVLQGLKPLSANPTKMVKHTQAIRVAGYNTPKKEIKKASRYYRKSAA